MIRAIRFFLGVLLVIQPPLAAVLFTLGQHTAAVLLAVAFLLNLIAAGMYTHAHRPRRYQGGRPRRYGSTSVRRSSRPRWSSSRF